MVHLSNKKIKAFSLIEVLISLAIVSFSILYLLIFATNLTKRATINKIQIQMNSVASSILEQAKSYLYTNQRNDNWNSYVNKFLKINTSTNKVETILNCNFNDNPLRDTCPSVRDLDAQQYNFIGYIMKMEDFNNNIYKLTIKVCCKTVSNNPKCPPGLKPVIYETYISKY